MNVLVLLKPDCIERELVEVALLTLPGKPLHASRRMPTKELLEAHYAEHKGRDYYQRNLDFMLTGEVVVLAVDVKDIQTILEWKRKFRADCGFENPRNLVHTSDSEESAAQTAESAPPESETTKSFERLFLA